MSYTKPFFVVAFSLLLVSCANTPDIKTDNRALSEASEAIIKSPVATDLPEFEDQSETQDAEQQELRPVVKHGTGTFVKSPRGTGTRGGAPEQGEITLNFEAVDLREVIKVIFEEILNENYLIDPGVQGVVTINTTLPVSKNDVLPILESILELNQATMVYQDSVYKIIPTANAKKMVTSPKVGDLRRAGQGIQVVPLKYVAAKEMQKILNSMSENPDNIKVDEVRNMLILNGSGRMINNYLNTIEMFDVDWLSGMSFGLFPLQHTDAKTIVEDLMAIIGDDQNGPLAGMVRLIPIERLNAVMVVSHQNYYVTQIKRLIDQFDLGIDKAPGRRLYVYRLKNGKAENIAEILQQIFGQQMAGGQEGAGFGSTESRNLSNISPAASSGVPLGAKETRKLDKLEQISPPVTPVRSTVASVSGTPSTNEAESSYPVTINGLMWPRGKC